MKPSYGRAFGIGALVGLVLGAAAMLFVGATGGIPKLGVTGEGIDLTPVFNVPASALWIVTILTTAAGGLVVAIATHAVARIIDPEARSVTLWIQRGSVAGPCTGASPCSSSQARTQASQPRAHRATSTRIP